MKTRQTRSTTNKTPLLRPSRKRKSVSRKRKAHLGKEKARLGKENAENENDARLDSSTS